MARVETSSLITSISGSTCRHDGTYFATNKQTGKVYAAKRCFSSDKPMTEAQMAQQVKFGSKAKFASAWWSKNKPSDENPNGTEAYQLIQRAFKGQHKIGNIFAYMRSLITDDNKVMVGDIDLTGGVSSGSESGGGQKPGGGGEVEG